MTAVCKMAGESDLSLNHFIENAAQSPPVRAECVPLIPHHLRGCKHGELTWDVPTLLVLHAGKLMQY